MDTMIYYIEGFIFYYPLCMSMFWMLGGLLFYFRRELGVDSRKCPELERYPLVSVLIPAHNEEQDIADTVRSVLNTAYPHLEVIVVNDASTDNTFGVLQMLSEEYGNVRVLNLEVNMGKANGLNLAYAMSKGEIILTIDADCLIGKNSIHWMVQHFINYPRVGAVTGNPRVRNRTSLLAKIQTAEYSSVVGLIKRTQIIIGKVMTVSGVIVAWRRSALISCGLWSNEMITDDIDMTWKIERKFWNVRYEANAVCWMLVPETLSGLWKQRKRWAQGGVEVVRKYRGIFSTYKQRRIWPIYLDYCLGILWAHAFLIGIIFYALLALGVFYHPYYSVGNILFSWNGAVISAFCILQFAVSCFVDYKYDYQLWRVYFYVVWYPVAYWAFNALAVVCVTWKGLTKPMDKNAVWVSPDRGIR